MKISKTNKAGKSRRFFSDLDNGYSKQAGGPLLLVVPSCDSAFVILFSSQFWFACIYRLTTATLFVVEFGNSRGRKEDIRRKKKKNV
jgi:hypothetical protein